MSAYVRTIQAERVRTPDARRALRAPIVRCTPLAHDDKRAAPNARATARAAYADGWSVRMTYAYGWEPDSEGFEKRRDITQETGEISDTGRKRKKKIGSEECDPVHSTRVILVHPTSPGVIVAGYWINADFDFGLHHDDAGWHPIGGIKEFERTIEHNAPGEAHLF